MSNSEEGRGQMNVVDDARSKWPCFKVKQQFYWHVWGSLRISSHETASE
jgi:hypothetical protein